jgi:hypothetical protein
MCLCSCRGICVVQGRTNQMQGWPNQRGPVDFRFAAAAGSENVKLMN